MTDILLVEDDANHRELLKEILVSEDYRVYDCGSVQEGSRLIEEREFDLIITDLVLPDAPGIDLVSIAKKRHALSEIIIITGHASLETAVRATEDGAAAYITKPFQINHLLSRVRKVLEKRQVSVANRKLMQELYRVNNELTKKVQELNAMQEKLVEAERLAAIHEVVVTLSHGINNPLTAIMASLEILTSEENGLTREGQEIISLIKKEAENIKTIMIRLLELKSPRTTPYVDDIMMIDLNS